MSTDPLRADLCAEINSYGLNIQSILEPLPEEELEKIQKSREYLTQKAYH